MQGQLYFMQRTCPQCESPLRRVWLHDAIEMGRCDHCGEVRLATVTRLVAPVIAEETEFEAIAINDNSRDFYLRLSRLVPEYNVAQLKRMENLVDGRRVIPLGIQASSIDAPTFMDRVDELQLTIELRLADE